MAPGIAALVDAALFAVSGLDIVKGVVEIDDLATFAIAEPDLVKRCCCCCCRLGLASLAEPHIAPGAAATADAATRALSDSDIAKGVAAICDMAANANAEPGVARRRGQIGRGRHCGGRPREKGVATTVDMVTYTIAATGVAKRRAAKSEASRFMEVSQRGSVSSLSPSDG